MLAIVISNSSVTKRFSIFMPSIKIVSFTLFLIAWRQCELLELQILKSNKHYGYCNAILKFTATPVLKLFEFNTFGIWKTVSPK